MEEANSEQLAFCFCSSPILIISLAGVLMTGTSSLSTDIPPFSFYPSASLLIFHFFYPHSSGLLSIADPVILLSFSPCLALLPYIVLSYIRSVWDFLDGWNVRPNIWDSQPISYRLGTLPLSVAISWHPKSIGKSLSLFRVVGKGWLFCWNDLGFVAACQTQGAHSVVTANVCRDWK